MSDLMSSLKITHSAMQAQSVRLNTIASNMANANSVSSNESETYRSLQPVFKTIVEGGNGPVGGVEVSEITKSKAPINKEYNPNHPMANADGYIFKPNVNFVDEQANFLSSKSAYTTQVEMANTLKLLTQKTLQAGKQ